MALGYTIAAILKRSSHVFCDDRVCVKLDWLEQLNRKYVQVFCQLLHFFVRIDWESLTLILLLISVRFFY
jgi:hypothetical protein